jgi:rRNA-processing protein FCF1
MRGRHLHRGDGVYPFASNRLNRKKLIQVRVTRNYINLSLKGKLDLFKEGRRDHTHTVNPMITKQEVIG